jgi:hypothetical protein
VNIQACSIHHVDLNRDVCLLDINKNYSGLENPNSRL